MKLKGYIFVGPNHDKSKIKEDMTEDEYKKLWDTLTNLKDTSYIRGFLVLKEGEQYERICCI